MAALPEAERSHLGRKKGAAGLPPAPPLPLPTRPSPAPQVRAMEIMSRHCMGDSPVRFQVLSDQAVNFTTG